MKIFFFFSFSMNDLINLCYYLFHDLHLIMLIQQRDINNALPETILMVARIFQPDTDSRQKLSFFALDLNKYIFANGSFKEASYSGGGNITFRGSLEGDAYFTTRLFQGELLLGNLPLQFIYSVSHLIFEFNWKATQSIIRYSANIRGLIVQMILMHPFFFNVD